MPRALPVLAATVIAAGALSVGVAAPAQAASAEFGHRCDGYQAAPGPFTIIYKTAGATNPLPAAAPQAGVITQLVLTLVPPLDPGEISAKTLRAAGGPDEYTVVSSTPIVARVGTTRVPVRLPVAAGDLLGLGGEYGYVCETSDPGDTFGLIQQDAPVGSTQTYLSPPQGGTVIPLVARVEPDADRDGFGDLSQDLCPVSATTQAACPPATIDSWAAGTSKKKLTVLLTSDTATTMTVSGSVKVGRKSFALASKTTSVPAGRFTEVTIALPKKLRKALAAHPASKRFPVVLTSSAPNLGSQPASTDTTDVTLRGTRR